MPPLARRIPALIAIAGLVLLAAFTWIERGPSLALLWPWHLYAQLLALLPALWLLAQLAVTGEFRRFGGLLDIGLLGFAGITIASALVSDRREIATSMLPIALVPVVLTYGLHQWLGADPAGRRKRLAEFGGLFLACATAVALGGWLWFRALPALAAGGSLAAILDGRNDWLLGHTVYTAGLALLCTTWLGGLAFERAGRSRLLCALGAMLGLILLFTSGSRSGFIGLAVWSGWLLWTETRRRRWSMGRTATLTLVVLAAAGAFALLHPRSRLIVREWHNSGTLNMGDRQRLAMAEFGLIALQERPLLGFGPGTTPLVYPAYRARLSGGVETALQLHSTPMQWLADSGTPALLAAVLVAAALWWRRKHETATFSCGTLLAYSALALTDYQLDLPLFAFALGTLLALCAQRQTAPEPRHAAARIGASIGIPLAAALVAYAATQVPPLRARASFALAIESLGQGDVAGFETGMAEAHRLSPRNTYYLNLHACILAAVQAYPTWFLPVDFGPDRKDRADALLRRSLEVDPCQELPHTHLAWHLLDTAPAEAIAHFRAAAQLIPDKGSLYFGQALVQLHLGRIDQASRALALELLNDPAFVTSPEWVRLAAVPGLVSTARHAAADELDRLAAAVPTTTPSAPHAEPVTPPPCYAGSTATRPHSPAPLDTPSPNNGSSSSGSPANRLRRLKSQPRSGTTWPKPQPGQPRPQPFFRHIIPSTAPPRNLWLRWYRHSPSPTAGRCSAAKLLSPQSLSPGSTGNEQAIRCSYAISTLQRPAIPTSCRSTASSAISSRRCSRRRVTFRGQP